MVVAALPAKTLARLVPNVNTAWHINVLVSSLLLILVIPLLAGGAVPGFCVLRWMSGHPCPFCDVTHAVALAIEMNWWRAATTHPVSLIIAPVIFAQVPLRLSALYGVVRLPYTTDRWIASGINGMVVGVCLVRYTFESL